MSANNIAGSLKNLRGRFLVLIISVLSAVALIGVWLAIEVSKDPDRFSNRFYRSYVGDFGPMVGGLGK